MEHKRYMRRLMSLDQCSSFVRWTFGGFAFFFAVLPWFMLAVFCSTGFSGTPGGKGACMLFAYLAIVSLFYHYTRALSVHWQGYPFYPEDRMLISRFHHTLALALVSGIVLIPWSLWGALAVIAGLLCVDLIGESKAVRFGEHTVRTARVQFDSMAALLSEAGASRERVSHSTSLPGIFRADEETWNESKDTNPSQDDSASDSNTTQCQKRKLQINGVESIEGMVRVSFKEGEEQTAVHLAFCPSLTTAPEIQTEIISDLDTEVEADVTLSQMYGARIELKRSASSGLPAQSVSLYYYASVPAVCERIAQ